MGPMTSRPLLRLLRDALAVLTVGCFMFPIFWWGLNSIKPVDAVFEHRGVVWFDFTPTFANYQATVLGQGPEFLAAREAMTASIIVVEWCFSMFVIWPLRLARFCMIAPTHSSGTSIQTLS